MSFIPPAVLWWLVLHLGSGARIWGGVTASRLPRLAHGVPANQLEGSLLPARDVPVQAVSLSDLSGNSAPPGPGARRGENLWRTLSRPRPVPSSKHGSPSEDPNPESYGEVEESDEAFPGLGGLGEAVGEEPSIESSSGLESGRSSRVSAGSTAVGGSAAGSKDHLRWIDATYPFLRSAMSTINLGARRAVAELLRRNPGTAVTLPEEYSLLTSSLEQYITKDPFIVEPYSNKGGFSFSFQRGELLGFGGNAVVYKVREYMTGREFAMKIYWVRSDLIGMNESAAPHRSRRFQRARRMVKRVARDLRSVRNAFVKGGSPLELLVHDFITVPVTSPGRVRSLPEFFTIKGEWTVLNSVGIFPIALTDLFELVASHGHQLTRNLRENLTREMVLGLAKVHAYGMAHRDVKPENILVNSTGQLSFTDFDSATPFTSPDGDPTQIDCAQGVSAGTELYFAPELARCGASRGGGTLPLSPAADAWALGMTLHVLWCEREIYANPHMGSRELLMFISSLAGRESLRLSFRGCHAMSPHIMSIIVGLLKPQPERRLTPLDIVRTSPFFQEKAPPPTPPPRRLSGTGTSA